MNIGFIGLGVMGNPMCANLIRSGNHRVRVFDIDDSKTRNLIGLGADRAEDVADAAGGADLVMTSLPGPDQVSDVAFGHDGLMANMSGGAAWIDLSTNNLTVCGRIIAETEKFGVEFLDGPVSGGDEGAAAGSLTILVGGNRNTFDRFAPVLDILGSNIIHLGENGAGYSAKIAQVVLCYLHSLALSEALLLGAKGGVEPAAMLNVIQNSAGKSYVSDRYGPAILAGDYDPSFTVGLAHKDMKLALDMADDLNIKLPMCELTAQTYAGAVERYGFEANHLQAVRLLEEDSGIFLRGR